MIQILYYPWVETANPKTFSLGIELGSETNRLWVSYHEQLVDPSKARFDFIGQ